MDILQLIKNRRTIRKYQNKPIPKKIINKIIEAGRWGPSLHGMQPWKFVVIKDSKVIEGIFVLLNKKAKKMYSGYNFVMSSTAGTIRNAKTLIAVYNTKPVANKMTRMGRSYAECAELSEIEAVSAAIQNIVLMARNLRLGICWTVFPLFCETPINYLLKENNKLLAILCLGFPEEKGKPPSKRNPISKVVKYI